ncbi:hypothetical protein [Shewanella seohaensis]|uniref:OmpR/PhoB-type domain-containing protein n=1 Tax=Shewanella seohaensis TaxID=755175 RepID=A0ABV4VZT5_9GAMM
MAESEHTRFKLKTFTIDCHNMTIDNGEKKLKLPVKVFEYLKLFLVNENHIVEHEDAIQRIWNGNEGVGKRGYINAMWQIRKAFTELGADCDEIFKTLPKVGYVLTVVPEPLPKLETPQKVKKGRLVLLLSFLLCTSILIFFIFFQKTPVVSDVATANGAMKFAALTGVTNFQGVEEHPAISHDGHLLAFQWLQENRRGGLYIKDLRDPQIPLRLVSSGKYQEALPIWSPDDKAIAYIRIGENNQCQIHVRQLATQQDTLIDTGCWYVEFKKMLDWSSDGRRLLYSKLVDGIVALFQYDFVTEQVTQVSFPEKNTSDLMAIWLADSQSIILVREKGQQYKLLQLTHSGQEKQLLGYKESITGLTRGKENSQIFVNYSENGKIATYMLDLKDSEEPKTKLVNQISGASGMSFNDKTNELFVTKHQSNEYIVQREFKSERILRRVFSSNRDLYGQYSADPESIIFVSNRSENWDLWLQNEHGTKNLTNGFGAVNFASVSPDGKYFATVITKANEDQPHLFMGNVLDGQLTQIDTAGFIPAFPTWSADGLSIYFSSISNNHHGIYQYDIHSSGLTQLTSSNEAYAISAGVDELFVSRTDDKGIWRFNIKSKQFTKVVDDLAIADFGSFFTQDGVLYYLSRTGQSDNVKQHLEGKEDLVIASYPADSVRKYFGISKGDQGSFLLTLNSIYDADIYSFPIVY